MDSDEQDPALYYDRHVFCCTNVRPAGHELGCCSAKGSDALRNYLRARTKELGLEKVRVNAAGCLDRCHLGPAMVIYPEGVWYRYQNKADVDEILEKHLCENGRVGRLLLKPDQ